MAKQPTAKSKKKQLKELEQARRGLQLLLDPGTKPVIKGKDATKMYGLAIEEVPLTDVEKQKRQELLAMMDRQIADLKTELGIK